MSRANNAESALSVATLREIAGAVEVNNIEGLAMRPDEAGWIVGEAADEIERLRSYLGSIAVHTDYPAVGCEQHMMEIARRALGMET